MTGVSIALVLGSALLHATWNARSNDGNDRVIELAIAYATGAVLLAPWFIADAPTEVLGFVVLSGVAHGAYITFLSHAYKRGGLATIYPLARGTAPLFVAGAGVWLLDQTPSAQTVVGVVVVALGLSAIGGVAWGKGEQMAILMALITGGCIATYTLIDARGVTETGELGYFSAASLVAVVVVLGLERPSASRIRKSLRPGITIGLFSTTSYGLILLAYSRADAANVATLRGTSILFGLLLVHRTLTRHLVFGAVAVVAGAVLVAA